MMLMLLMINNNNNNNYYYYFCNKNSFKKSCFLFNIALTESKMRKNKQTQNKQTKKKPHSFTGKSAINLTQSKFTHRNDYWLLDSDVLYRLTLNLGLSQPANTTERSIESDLIKIFN